MPKKSDKPKIGVLHTGGTIAMHRDASGLLEVPKDPVKFLLRIAPLMKDLINVKFRIVDNIDSASARVANWSSLISAIDDVRSKVDGIIVLHGTDTLEFSAACVAFAFPDLEIPCIFTGAQLAFDEPESDVLTNLMGAVYCVLDPRLVGSHVVFNNKVFRGENVEKVKA